MKRTDPAFAPPFLGMTSPKMFHGAPRLFVRPPFRRFVGARFSQVPADGERAVSDVPALLCRQGAVEAHRSVHGVIVHGESKITTHVACMTVRKHPIREQPSTSQETLVGSFGRIVH